MCTQCTLRTEWTIMKIIHTNTHRQAQQVTSFYRWRNGTVQMWAMKWSSSSQVSEESKRAKIKHTSNKDSQKPQNKLSSLCSKCWLNAKNKKQQTFDRAIDIRRYTCNASTKSSSHSYTNRIGWNSVELFVMPLPYIAQFAQVKMYAFHIHRNQRSVSARRQVAFFSVICSILFMLFGVFLFLFYLSMCTYCQFIVFVYYGFGFCLA